MIIQTITNSLGIDDIKITAQNETERNFILSLANAGSLTCITSEVGNSVVFRSVSVMEEDFVSSQVSNSNSIGVYNFELRQNEDRFFTLNFTSNGGVAMDLNVYDEIILQVKHHKHGAPVVALEINSGLEINPDQTSQLKVLFKAFQTEKLNQQQYYYDVLFRQGTENKYLLEGEIVIKQSVSR